MGPKEANTQKNGFSKEQSSLEKELGLKEGMHGKPVCTLSPFVQSLVANLGDNYIVVRSYSNASEFAPRVVLCGYTHTAESRQELKDVLNPIVTEKDVILMEADDKEDEPFKSFAGKVKKIDYNDDLMRLALQLRAQLDGNPSYIRFAIKRNRDQFAPSIIRHVREDKDARVFQRIGHRHIIEWTEIMEALEKENIPYIAIIPKVNHGYTEEQNNAYNRIARSAAKAEF